MRWLVLILMLMPGPALAGPWARDKGDVFVVTSTDGRSYSLWGEYGLGRGQWVVVDAVFVPGGLISGQVGWHRNLAKPDARHQFATGIAIGTQYTGLGDVIPYVSTSVSWGMGLQKPWPGWVSVDLENRVGVSWLTGGFQQAARGQLTVGANLGERTKAMVQLQGTYNARGAGLFVAPSLVYEWRKDMHIELGLRQDLLGSSGQTVKLASWFKF